MNYDAKTDRELDALVAEKVMGVDACLIHEPKSFLHPDYCFGCKKSFPHRYSTVVTYAFSVVEAMRERGSDYFVLMHDEGNKWGAAFSVEAPWRGGKAWKQYESDNQDNPARAIVIAALRTLDA